MACQKEADRMSFYFGLSLCPSCFDIVKKKPSECNSHQLRLIANFYSFWSGIKYSDEKNILEKEKAKQKRLMMKFKD